VGLVLRFRLVALHLSQVDQMVSLLVPLAAMDQNHSHLECLSQDQWVSLLGPLAGMVRLIHLFHLECLSQDLRVSKQALQARLDQISYSHQGFKVVKDRLC
jgi:hypothetical protein